MRRYPLVRLPRKTDLVLFLIKQELKSNKFFNSMAEMGGGDCYYPPNLDSVILSYSGFKEFSDDLMEFYVKRLDHYSKKIGPDDACITKYAFKLLVDLEMEKRKRKYTDQPRVEIPEIL